MKYGTEWPGYINVDVGGNDPVDVFQILAETSKAADMYLGEEAGVIRFRHREVSDVVAYPVDLEDFEIADLEEVPAYRAVLITYADGKVLYPATAVDTPARLILSLPFPYVTSYGHALLLAKRYYNYYNSGATIYNVSTIRDGLGMPPLGEEVTVGAIQGRLLMYTTSGARINLNVEKVGERLGIGEALCL